MTIYEVLESARLNLNENGAFGALFAKEQLDNAMTFLENGYNLNDEFDEEKLDELKEG